VANHVASAAVPVGFIAPCLPTNAPGPPSGKLWLHEIKHDGFRHRPQKQPACEAISPAIGRIRGSAALRSRATGSDWAVKGHPLSLNLLKENPTTSPGHEGTAAGTLSTLKNGAL
jgi:hypothetical protein